jgi:putative heme-binding domain-containing protein
MKIQANKYKKVLCAGVALAMMGGANALPEGWKITEFAAPPQAEYPAAISAAANGDVYISSDRNGSLGKNPQFGKVVRATDTDGDGKADDFRDFVPLVNSPRGGHFVGGTFYLIHPPYLSSFRDTTGDGVADEKKTLVTGFGWGIEHPRGADHTTNGARMGIDGWLYISVGDFGMPDAVGADGTRYTLWGGGLLRVRPDGSEMEPYSFNVRNICDVAITPTLDMFSRDNTNDGKGWNTRFHHFMPMGDCGYPRLYQKFSNETIVALRDYGGGSGTGALALDEPGFPAKYKNSVFTCDWATGNIYHHPMKPMGETFEVQQEIFHPLKSATDIDVDGSSRLYLADWRNGGFSYHPSQKVGMVQMAMPPNWQYREFPDLKKMSDADLVDQVGSDSAVMRLEAQREMISRGIKPVFSKKLLALAKEKTADIGKRVAAVFTYKQLLGEDANAELNKLAKMDSIREYALRALTDRKTQLKGVDPAVFVLNLKHEDPRVRIQALNGLARLGAIDTAPAILSSLAGQNLDAGDIKKTERRYVPHVGIKALASLQAVDACLAAVKDISTRPAALRALQEMHLLKSVDGLIAILASNPDADTAEGALSALARLHFRENKWDLKTWWHTRPDDRGPYYEPTVWEGTAKIRTAIQENFAKVSEARRVAFISLLADNRIPVSTLKLAGLDPVVLALGSPEPDAATLALLSDATCDLKRSWDQRLLAYQSIGRAQPDKAVPLHVKSLAAWTEAKEPQAATMVSDFINEPRRANEVKFLNEVAKKGEDAESAIAWKAMLTVLRSPLTHTHYQGQVRALLATNPMEVGLFNAIAEMKLSGFDQQIAAAINSDNEKTIFAAKAAKAVGAASAADGRKVGDMKHDEVAAHSMNTKGDVKNGERIYVSQGCIACHAIDLNAAQKGPYLGSSGAKFQRDYLIKSILDPNALVAQGFQTYVFTMKDGNTHMGFVTKEQDDVIQLRDIAGQVTEIKRSNVKEEKVLPQSMMPPGIANSLSIGDFNDLIEYLVSLKKIGG